MDARFEDRCVGCLLGLTCGDILGASVEGWSASEIREIYGEIRDFDRSDRGFSCYTDDTQMTLALASSLVEHGRVDAEQVSTKYAEFYESWRGYGGGARVIMRALRMELDYRATGRMQFPDGSYGNGGAMRIAPVGLAYRHANDDSLYEAVEDALLCTHVNPEAIDGAFVQAKAVAIAATTSDPANLEPRQLLQALRRLSRTDIMQSRIEKLIDCLVREEPDVNAIGRVGNGIRASQAVPAALWAFVRYGQNPEECVVRAVNFGGDTDTIGAMAGALVGALHGKSWIPIRWHDNIENGKRGRDEIAAVARAIARLDIH